MSDDPLATGPIQEERGQSASSGTPETAEGLKLPDFLPPPAIVAQLSKIRHTQPVAALAAVNQYQQALTEVFLQAIEHGVSHPREDFASHGMLFNYASYFLAKWREKRAYPLLIRWFSLPGEDALELGGDTLTVDGARLLASVCGGELQPIRDLLLNREANEYCRGQALLALGVLVGWGELPAQQTEEEFLGFAREKLERQPNQVWRDLAVASINLEFLSVFPELRRAHQEGLIHPSFLRLEDLDQAERAPRGTMAKAFADRFPPITDVIHATRWWAGFQKDPQTGSPVALHQPVVSPPKVGRNDLCPCGSGKKFKKCCGA